METLKVAFFCWESLFGERVGGLANAATHLAETLATNHEVHFFTRGCGKDREVNGVYYHYCQPVGSNIIEYCNSMSQAMVDQFRIEDHFRFDVLHFHDWHPVQALHYLQDRDTIFTYHSTEYGRNGNQFGDWWEFREISGKEWYAGLVAKRVTAVSQTLKNEVIHLYRVPEGKCDVVPNGVEPRRFEADLDAGEVKKAYGIHPYAPLILFIGRLAYQKGPDLLIDALPGIQQHRWDVRLLVAGDGGMRSHLEDAAVHLPVQFLGYVSDSEYIRLLNAADVVAIPSRNEPFGIVLLEAWSAERCVVATDVGGLSENIQDGVDGIKVAVNPQNLREGINRALQDPEEAMRYGRLGRKKIDKMFHWTPIVKSLVDSYIRVLS
jgi:glycogen(starch) synthase